MDLLTVITHLLGAATSLVLLHSVWQCVNSENAELHRSFFAGITGTALLLLVLYSLRHGIFVPAVSILWVTSVYLAFWAEGLLHPLPGWTRRETLAFTWREREHGRNLLFASALPFAVCVLIMPVAHSSIVLAASLVSYDLGRRCMMLAGQPHHRLAKLL